MKYTSFVCDIYESERSLRHLSGSNFKRIRKDSFSFARCLSRLLQTPCKVLIYKNRTLILRSKVKYNYITRKYSNFRY